MTLCIIVSEIHMGQTAKTNLLVLGFVWYFMLPSCSYYKSTHKTWAGLVYIINMSYIPGTGFWITLGIKASWHKSTAS